MEHLITGIQQCGIGTRDAHEAALYYKELFGMDTLLFDDTAEAKLMTAPAMTSTNDVRSLL